jgi:hypothetical protein|tara:strand:+ start:7319 stop:7516 length:198 start_codon:yes stop_codon:yes gene_type:complete
MSEEGFEFQDFQHLINIRLSNPLERVIYLLALHAEHIEEYKKESSDLDSLQVASWHECAETLGIT